MKKLLLIAIVACLSSCERVSNHEIAKQTNTYRVGNEYSSLEVSIVIVDSCEYLRSHVYGGDTYEHKGNCKFCKQRNN